MKQALHIFAKDVRHFWPEIAVSVTIMALYAWIGRYAWAATVWAGGVPQGAEQLNRLANIMPVLIQLSWWVLITRLVQTESLVGDRQWWITKPYEWPRLLGGKGLFLAVFVALPLLVVQCVLMVQAGFQPAEYLAGMGFDLLLVATILVLPLMVLATVTSGFGKMTLTVIGVVIAVVLIIAMVSMEQQSHYSAPFDWGAFYMGGFALTKLRVEKTTQMVMPAHDFAVEGLGMCTPVKEFLGSNFTSIWCRSAMRRPPVTHVSVEWSSTPCDAAPSGQAGVAGSAWAGSDVSDPAEFGISPVQQVSLPFSNSVDRGYVYTPGMNHPRYLCAGTPLTFTRYAVVGRSREDVTLKNFQLPDWRQPVINGNGIATFGVE